MPTTLNHSCFCIADKPNLLKCRTGMVNEKNCNSSCQHRRESKEYSAGPFILYVTALDQIKSGLLDCFINQTTNVTNKSLLVLSINIQISYTFQTPPLSSRIADTHSLHVSYFVPSHLTPPHLRHSNVGNPALLSRHSSHVA